jgi:hypothetical protein
VQVQVRRICANITLLDQGTVARGAGGFVAETAPAGHRAPLPDVGRASADLSAVLDRRRVSTDPELRREPAAAGVERSTTWCPRPTLDPVPEAAD